MTDKEFFVFTIQDELPRFERALHALPQAALAYRPHERSRSAAEIVNAMARETSTFPMFLKEGRVDFAPIAGMPATMDTASDVASFLQHLAAAKDIASSLSEPEWNSNAQMLFGEKVEWETTRGKMAWGLILDLIHHRGQLSAYIRPMGGSVPPIYGPSGDQQG